MGLLAFIIVLGCGFYIYKNIAYILAGHIGNFVHSNQISRSEDGNDFIAMVATIILTFLAVVFIIILSYKIFRGLYLLPLIALCLYFRFGTNVGK
ncbi:hypothetical protein BUZ06_11105 [Staphylococcus gallinarum]|uniref:hypothetical protein n=1 Tax=Staphylococcus gallinarum TaxID=1293 RepID=UPI000E685BF9|nr:hypothetical protein [Staphylococcus gallinarum]RIO87364.1 hypothetical protein BUZ06_11105 [Staphylococcus gallinarum]